MGFLDKLKSAFLEEEEGDVKPADNKEASTAKQAEAKAEAEYRQPGEQEFAGIQNVSAEQPEGRGKINPDLLKTFEAALREFNLPGPDYLELKGIMDNENFRKNIPDEKQRIVSAFFSIQAGNPSFSKAIVMDSLKHYIDKMEGERISALQQLGKRVTEEITAPMKEVEAKRKRIEQLQAEIAKLNGEIDGILQQVEQKKADLNTKKLDFDVTINALIGELKSDMTKIDNAIN